MSETEKQHARTRASQPVEGPAAIYERAGAEGPAAEAEPIEVEVNEAAPGSREGEVPSPTAVGEGVETADLAAELEAERTKANEYLEQWRRAAADFSNFKRRTEQERSDMAKLFVEGLVKSLLPALDNFERALASVPEELKGNGWVEGVSLTEKQLRSALEREGLTAIEAIGQKFDPNLHEAVAHDISDEQEDDSVIEEFQKGYKLHDRVIRPSMVKVSRRS
jgi:molecular chaperone GrpE